jgi:hypothetical protein
VPPGARLDERGREVLTFVEGRPGIVPFPDGVFVDDGLVRVAQLHRRYHDAAAGFRPPAGSAWRHLVGVPREGEVVCHNDLAPYNTIYDAGRPCALIDWDLAAPAPRAWDVACALWRFVPLYGDQGCGAMGIPVRTRGPRLRLYCDAYG